jgi:hypothetical protein
MEIAIEPELYSPNVDDMGVYIDKIPTFIGCGIRCACGSRRDKIYTTYSTFASHIKTKHHQKWLIEVNANRANYYTKNLLLEDTVMNQRLIIAKLEKELQTKSMTIDYLTIQLNHCVTEPVIVTNLLEFD